MERSQLPRELRPFVDEDGRLNRWPSRHKVQRMAATLLAARFERGREYTEAEVNFLLIESHTFGDWAIIRRSLVDWRYLDRESNGSRYRLRDDAPTEFEAAAVGGERA